MSGGILGLLNSPLATMAILFGSIQLLRFIDMANPKAILALRMGYIGSQMAMLIFWTWMRGVVKKSKKGVEVLEFEEPAKPFSGEAPKKAKMTFSEYDSLEVGKQMQQLVIGTVIMLVLHVWFGMVQPLFLQIILPWKSLITSPLVQIHLFGYSATGALKRPFKQPNPFSEFMGEQTATTTDEDSKNEKKKTIKEAERVEDSSSEAEGSTNSSTTASKTPTFTTASRKKGGRKEE